jgi:hypothetical protein
METLLIGNIKKIDAFYKWLNVANDIFDVKLIIAEDNLKSEKFDCRIEPLAYVESITNEYDIIFVCSDFADKIAYVLVQMGIEKEKFMMKILFVNICLNLIECHIMPKKLMKNITIKDMKMYVKLVNLRMGSLILWIIRKEFICRLESFVQLARE